MGLVELIAQADARGLAASGLACLDRCLPLLDGDDELVRPLWGSLADDSDWGGSLARARDTLGSAESVESRESAGSADGEAALLTRRMLETAPDARTADALRPWADACSAASLRVHRLLDPAVDGGPGPDGGRAPDGGPDAGRAGGAADLPPLVAAELRRQTAVLELLAEHGAQGLRRALDISVEGRRVLRAVVSRRARGTVGPGM
ncbi:hypothetical protein [Streptomyces sp. NRRL S-31]|uniref:hypothetical protein n=1 Tax=Streptomyces sp. NRRL S-31 TaxID=1463898 RepID=UPI0004CBEDE3|nr:hypothetical protein [Streptomyces sp. NRRL S-31]